MEERVSKDPSIFNEQVIKNRDYSIGLYGEHQKRDVNRLLAMKIKGANGKLNSMFAVVEDNGLERYCCLLCSKRDMGVLKLISHAGSKTHKLRLHTAGEKYSSSIPRVGSNDKVPTELQARLNVITDQVMIGVEYVIEVSFGETTFEPIFHCVLCEGRFDLQVIIHHLTSYVHRLKYFEKHFPTAFKKISRLEKREQKYNFLEKVCQNIEDNYGRLSLTVVRSDEFSTNQGGFYESVLNGRHFDEQMGRTFAELIDLNESNELSPISDFDETTSTCALDSISTSSEFKMSQFKASDKVLLSPSSLLSHDHKLSLSPISPERTSEFDRNFPLDESLLQLSRNEDNFFDQQRAIYERKKPFKKTNDTNVNDSKYCGIRKSNSSSLDNYTRKVKKTESADRKTSIEIKIEKKSPKRKCTRKRNDRPHSGVCHNRDRSRSPQGRRQSFMRNYRKSSPASPGYRKMKTDANFRPSLSSGRSEYALSKPSHERTNRTDYLLSHKAGYNRTTTGLCENYKFISTSIEPDLAVREYSLCRPSVERTNGTDYLLNRNGGYNQRTETMTASGPSSDYRSISTCNEPDIYDGEPITIISVLSLLSAFEYYLGSLGPKVIELMTEALAMENISVNFSNRILDDINHFVLFDATKEKLKGVLKAGIVEEDKRVAVKRTIKCMDALIGEANARKHLKIPSSKTSNCRIDATECSTVASLSQIGSPDWKYAIAEKISAAMYERGRADISKVELAQYVDQYITLTNGTCDDNRGLKCEIQEVIDKSPQEYDDSIINNTKNQMITEQTYEPTIPATTAITDSSALPAFPSTTLTDANLATLTKNFAILSDVEKQEVMANIRYIEFTQPERMQRLRNQLKIDKLLNFKF